MSQRRRVRDTDTKAELEWATPGGPCCRTCEYSASRGCTSGPACSKHYATDLNLDQTRVICKDHVEKKKLPMNMTRHLVDSGKGPECLRRLWERQLAEMSENCLTGTWFATQG